MLTVDVGNSSIGIGKRQGDRISVVRCSQPEEAARLLDEESVGITVSIPRWDALAAAVGARGGPTPHQLTGVPIPVAEPRLGASAGADRLAAVLAALPGPAVVVDAGTAVTVDVVDAAGVYRGGFIAAGPGVALSGLVAGAPALPHVPLTALGQAPLAPGLDTLEALSSGAWGMAVGGVDRLVDEALQAAGPEGSRLLVTGGWGQSWLAMSRHGVARGGVVLWDEALVHRGILRWAEGGG